MAAAARKHRDLALRRIDVKSWGSPVAKQYRIRSLPTFRLYDDRGKQILQGRAVYKRVMAWKSAKKKTSSRNRGQESRSPTTRPAVRPGFGVEPVPEPRPAERIRLVSKRGERVYFEAELAEGKFTLFEFYADWCTESGKLAPELQSAVKKTSDLILCRIRVKSMSSPVLRQHEVKSLPHFVLFDPKGELVKDGPKVIEDILKWEEFKAARPQR